MSYGLRNTLYLSLTLLLMIAAGWGLIHFTQTQKLEELENTLSQKEAELQAIKSSSENYDEMLTGFLNTTYKVENHKKELMPDNRVPAVYDYLRIINQGVANTEINFTWSDSVTQSNYGINKFTITGSGNYRNLYNFVQRMERSKPLYKINSLQLQTVNEADRLNHVTFSFQVDSYYDREQDVYQSSMNVLRTSMGITHNPFFPLIHSVPPNEDNLLNVDSSRLIALSRRNAYLVDQNGALQTLEVGDRVYLGRLQNINDDHVTFLLNRGGIADRVTMEIRTRL